MNANTRLRLLGWLGLLILLFACIRLDYDRIPWNSDENDMASLAVAMTESTLAWTRPTYHPFEPGAYESLGKGVVAPPLANVLMTIPSLLGLREPWTWPLVSFLVLFLGLIFLTRSLSRFSWFILAGAVGLSITLSPWFLIDTLTLKPDVPLAGFALLSLAFSLLERSERLNAILSGICMGLAFLCKLWLIIPLAFATFLSWSEREYPRKWLNVNLYCFFALLIGFSHLIAVAFIDTDSFGRWLNEVYFAIFTSGGVASTKWTGVAAHPEWSHGYWYYFLAIPREIGFALPFALYGIWRLKQEASMNRLRQFLAIGLGMLIGVGILSVPPIKEPLYVLSVVGVGIALAAYGIVILVQHPRLGIPALIGVAILSTFLALIAHPTQRPYDAVVQPHVRLKNPPATAEGQTVPAPLH